MIPKTPLRNSDVETGDREPVVAGETESKVL